MLSQPSEEQTENGKNRKNKKGKKKVLHDAVQGMHAKSKAFRVNKRQLKENEFRHFHL